MSIRRTLRTVRHLKPSQIAWRMRYRWRRRRPPVVPAVPGELPVREDRPVLPPLHGFDGFDGYGGDDGRFLEDLSRGAFTHLGERAELGRPIDWRLGTRTGDRLWTVTLHYHQWAVRLAAMGERGAPLLRELVGDWIERCALTAPGSRALAWNSYAIATRILAWYRVAALSSLEVEGLHASLWQQAAFLHANLERDLRGNHLLRDAVGLAVAGRFFAGEEPRRWHRSGVELGLEQVREQVLADGGHFERSPMYHLHAMEDVLHLALVAEDETARAELIAAWQRMAQVAAWLRHPDGTIPLFNDAAGNGACEPGAMLEAGARALGLEPELAMPDGHRHFPDLGLVVGQGGKFRVFFDVGVVGPDYQPGHAHADTLSLECSFAGRRLFVDPGTFHYDEGPTREYDRSTDAHNTVCIDGVDSSEVWHIFRVGRRARPRGVRFEVQGTDLRARASHDGYTWLPGAPRHTRTLQLDAGGLAICDRVESGRPHDLRGGFLLAPEWTVQESRPDGFVLRCEGAVLDVQVTGPEGLELRVESREHHPDFGHRVTTQRLSWRWDGALPIEIRTVVRG